MCYFCGGKSCKHENWKNNPRNPKGLDGLHSDWITKDILATQRPSSRIIKEYGLVDRFKKSHIGAIFCLQEPGEHPHCGDGIHESSGLSYLPEEFNERIITITNRRRDKLLQLRLARPPNHKLRHNAEDPQIDRLLPEPGAKDSGALSRRERQNGFSHLCTPDLQRGF